MRVAAGLILLFCLSSCDRVAAPATPDGPARANLSKANLAELDSAAESRSVRLWDHTGTELQGFSARCREFEASVAALLKTPTQPLLHDAQQQWHHLHGQLRQQAIATSLASYNPGLFAPLVQLLGNIDQQPIAPGYLDSVAGYPDSGLIYDISLKLNHTSVRQQHGLTADNEASLGLHPLEFLLFGESGQRRAQEFKRQSKAGSELSPANLPQNRRRDYLALSSKLLCDDSEQLARQWADHTSSLAAPYFALSASARLQLWHSLLAAELDNLSRQQPEHACDFSPNGCDTHGRYLGLQKFINALDDWPPALSEQQGARWQAGVAALDAALKATPGDELALQQAILALAEALNDDA